MNHIYLITELNVDGCGTDATEYVASEAELTQAQLDALRALLRDVKRTAAGKQEDLSTGDMIDRALGLFAQGHHIRMSIVSNMFAGTITF